jgi:predicted nucleic acid-binding protein
MKTIFADTFYWIALINDRDNWHERVVLKTRELKQIKIITTDEVCIEVLNNLKDRILLKFARAITFFFLVKV